MAVTEGDQPDVALAVARARAAAGLPIPVAAIPGRSVHRRAVALAVELGAPLAPVLEVVEQLAVDDRSLRAAVRRASAEGRAVAVGLVAAPPVLGVAAAALATDDPWAWTATAAGRSLLSVAGLLWLTGVLVVWASVRRAARPPVVDDEVFVLTAVAVRAGEPVSGALRRAGGVVGPGRARDPAALALWLDLGGQGSPPRGWGSAGAALSDAVAQGLPSAPLLDELARLARAQAHDQALERAARLGARLSVPTSLLLLPAGLLVAAGPLLLSALPSS